MFTCSTIVTDNERSLESRDAKEHSHLFHVIQYNIMYIYDVFKTDQYLANNDPENIFSSIFKLISKPYMVM